MISSAFPAQIPQTDPRAGYLARRTAIDAAIRRVLESGSYILGDTDVAQVGDDRLSELRSQRIGFIFQNFNLIQQLTVLENLEVPMFYLGYSPAQRRARAAMPGGAPSTRDRPRLRARRRTQTA